ncbi:MAG TPA: hypothetical protein VGK10_03680 [Prolixibacteraceae bacterium]|jgi:hypothetical protein
MTWIENDYSEMTPKGINHPKDFHEFIPRYLSHKNNYHPHGFHASNLNPSSYVVDWQLQKEENPDVEKWPSLAWH